MKHPCGYDILTVRELVALLSKMPQDAMVWHEGCDCHGAADGVRDISYLTDEPVQGKNPRPKMVEQVLITRNN
jgi:hypothetical protein